MKEQTTPKRILDAARELMLDKSFHSVGLKQILDAVKVPKGSFYYYFASKEQFGVELLKHYLADASTLKRSLLISKKQEADPLKRLFAYLNGSINFIQSNPGKFPCLALKLASEVSDLSEGMREELARGFQDWIGIYQEVLEEAVSEKMLPATLDTASEAQLIQDLLTGAIKRAVIDRCADPVVHAVGYIQSQIERMKL